MKLSSIGLICLVASVGLCTSASADPIAFSEGVIKWDTLTISTDPGMTITWREFVDPAKEAGVWAKAGADLLHSQIAGWGPTSIGGVSGNLAAGGVATDSQLVGYSSISGSAGDHIATYGGAERWGIFEVHGSGSMKVSVDYSLMFDVDVKSLSPSAWVSTWAQVNLELGQFIPSPTGGGGLWAAPYSEDLLRLTKLASGSQEPTSQVQSGTLTAEYSFSDGNIGKLEVGGHGKLWAEGVPDYGSTATLLGFGLVGIMLIASNAHRKERGQERGPEWPLDKP